MLKIRNLRKAYGGYHALNGLDMEIADGALYGFVGPNGAGKTTAIRIMTGLLRADSGTVEIDGMDAGADPYGLREKIGYVPDSFGVYDNLKVSEYMEFFAACYGMEGFQARKRSSMLLEQVGLGEKADFFVESLSRGMKQRLGLARALLHNPSLLIMDEPTSGLDPGERVRFRNLLSEFAHDRIVLISTHIVPDVEYIAMKNAVMKDGKIIETGTTPELVKRMEGKVFSEKIPARALADYEKKLRIVNLKNEPDGDITIRYLGDRPETEDSVSEEPRLEDLYLWLFPQNTDGRKTEERGTKGGKRR